MIDGTYTRLLRTALNISWRDHVSNDILYDTFPKLSSKIRERRIRLAGHYVRHNEEEASIKISPMEPNTRWIKKRKAYKTTYTDTLYNPIPFTLTECYLSSHQGIYGGRCLQNSYTFIGGVAAIKQAGPDGECCNNCFISHLENIYEETNAEKEHLDSCKTADYPRAVWKDDKIWLFNRTTVEFKEIQGST